MKCSDCRKKEIELLTPWERIKDKAFRFFFSEDIIDLSQGKFTQGFGDGIEVGREMERNSIRRFIKERHNIDI